MNEEISRAWWMFLDHLKNAVDENQRHAHTLIERDKVLEGIHDREIRKRVSSGRYGETAKEMWEIFSSTIDD